MSWEPHGVRLSPDAVASLACPSFGCQHTRDPPLPHRHSLRSEALLCVALTLDPVSIFRCLLLMAETGFSAEAVGVQDNTLVWLCPLGTSSLLTSAVVNYTPEIYCDWWLHRAVKTWSEVRQRAVITCVPALLALINLIALMISLVSVSMPRTVCATTLFSAVQTVATSLQGLSVCQLVEGWRSVNGPCRLHLSVVKIGPKKPNKRVS